MDFLLWLHGLVLRPHIQAHRRIVSAVVCH
jgi:hypothetical protein